VSAPTLVSVQSGLAGVLASDSDDRGEQDVQLDLECLRHTGDRLQGRVPHPSFDSTEVGAVEAGAEGELLLRDPELLPMLPYCPPKVPQEFHGQTLEACGISVHGL
jgi:hypothetical protein